MNTYRHSSVRSVLSLSLVKFHLLLLEDGRHLGMLRSDYKQ